ncbi:uncharacterized protein F5147DRAFT_770088 [Suillus discolor]|uniref:Uncharacterized protein n=1 Tax=Suillus discolor TaxID=1912936 RepID=A0A9P7FD77_9AGAM|nr:uncharacterized protein F5147DRAFT_770088 [Suillus discolor]KAG2114773.1 hypothetical protein F5147DRAFT_770088 [Suillus discolor]
MEQQPPVQSSDNFFHGLPQHSIPLYTNPAPASAPLITAYTPVWVAQGHLAFGVPMSGVSMPAYNARSRTRGTRIMRPAHQRVAGSNAAFNVLLVLLPKDLTNVCNEDAPDPIDEDFYTVTRMRTGKDLASDLHFLSRHGLTKKLTLQHRNTDHYVLDELTKAISEKNFTIFPFDSSLLAISTPIRLQFSTFQKKCERVRAPDDGSTGLLYLCPKGGPLIGPVEPRSPQQHFCFANCIMGHLVQGFDNAPSLPGHFFTTPCKAACPANDAPNPPASLLATATPRTSSSSITGSSSSAVPHYHNRDRSGSPHPNRQTPSTAPTSSMSSGSNILAGPITRYQNRDRSASPRPVQYQRRPRSPSSTPDNSQAASPSTHIPLTSADIHDLSDLSHAIHVSADLEYSTSTLHFEADTLNDVADGLINVLKHCHVRLTDRLDSEPLNFTNPVPGSTFATYRREHLTRHDLTIGDIKSVFSMSSWMFRAGSPDATDSIGDGVMRQVIDTTLHKCLRWTSDTTEVHGDLSAITGDASIMLDDDFVSLKLSRFPSAEKLAVVFTIGRLCALHLLKVCNAPHPITPAIFSLIINGASSLTNQGSINDHGSWLRSVSPALADVLASLPAADGSASNLPVDAANRSHITRICQSRLDTSFSEIRRTPPDRWPIVRKDFIFAALLGYSHEQFLGSREYEAFRDGFDMYLMSSIPSLAQILQVNFNEMLPQIYDHQPSADAIESMLRFEVDGDSTFCSQISPHLHFFKNAVLEYLRGTGHPAHSMFEGLDDSEAIHPNHCARQFVKVLSGIPLLPSDSSTCFKVIVVQNVPQDTCFGGALNPETDLIPPIAHACMHRLDIFANAPIINWLVTAPSTCVDESPLGICLHTALVELGEDSFNGRLPLSV